MKSKSPFAIKSPLLAYKSDMKGNYANPEYVPETIVGAEIGANIAKTAASVFESYAASKKGERKAAADKASGGSNVNNQTVNVHYGGSGGKKDFKFGHDFGETKITPDPPRFPGSKGTPTNETTSSSDKYNTKLRPQETAGQKVEKLETNKETYLNSFNAGFAKNNEGYDDIDDYIKFKESKYQPKKQMFAQDFKNNVAQGDEYEVDIDNQKTNYSVMNMKGSPNKHNAGAVGSIGNADPLAGGIGGIAQAVSQDGSRSFSDKMNGVGQQTGNQAQQDVLPPPNQVAETGSYGSGGDRDMLEMNGNQINNQSIGRNTDITSQLFGSGQRASMLAMKGTPLHHDSEKQAHKHPSKTTTKMSGKGEMPGSSYVKGDIVDEDDLQNVGLQTQNATLAQSDDKGTFIKEMPYTGPESNISTAKGFGEKIRLNNMSRPDYTSNEGDQMNPHDFLFKNTPKK